jgi:hypothetical protein
MAALLKSSATGRQANLDERSAVVCYGPSKQGDEIRLSASRRSFPMVSNYPTWMLADVRFALHNEIAPHKLIGRDWPNASVLDVRCWQPADAQIHSRQLTLQIESSVIRSCSHFCASVNGVVPHIDLRQCRRALSPSAIVTFLRGIGGRCQ